MLDDSAVPPQRNKDLIELERFAGRFVPICYAFCAVIVVALITAFAATAELLNNAIIHARERGAANYNGNAALTIRVFEQSIEFVDTPANG